MTRALCQPAPPAGLDALGTLKVLCSPLLAAAVRDQAAIAYALQQMSAAMEAAWPAAACRQRQRAQRQLARQHWVPAVPPAEQQRREEQQGGDTPLAAALRQALQQHCPEVSLEDLHRYCLMVRLIVTVDHLAAPPTQALLTDCQVLLLLLLLLLLLPFCWATTRLVAAANQC